MVKFLIVCLILGCLIATQDIVEDGCISPRGESVDWFVVYSTPERVHSQNSNYGYLYMDSNSQMNQFQLFPGHADHPKGPIGRTIALANQNDLSSIAWNDKLSPEQGVGSSNGAHSRVLMALRSLSHGFVLVHSVPQYPNIGLTDQNRYFIEAEVKYESRKHSHSFFCMSMNGQEQATAFLRNSIFTSPNIYHNSLDLQLDFDYSKSIDTFIFEDFDLTTGQVHGVFKASQEESSGSIFSEGVTQMIKSSIILQGNGLPLPFKPFCDEEFKVENAGKIVFNNNVAWPQWLNEGKWAYAIENNFVCFGDLDRNSQKEKARGGAYYCWESKSLNMALKRITPNPERCLLH